MLTPAELQLIESHVKDSRQIKENVEASVKASTEQGTKAHEARLKDCLKGIQVPSMSHRIADLYIISVQRYISMSTAPHWQPPCSLHYHPHCVAYNTYMAVQITSESPALPETKTSPYQESR